MLLPRFFFSLDFAPFRPYLLSLPLRAKRFRRGDYLWKPSEPFGSVYYIESGLVRSAIEDKLGRRTTAWHGPGTMFPVAHSTRFELESSITTEAITDVAALEFPNAAILSAIRENPDFAMATIDWYAKFVNLLLFAASRLVYANALTALATVLLLLFENEPEARLGASGTLRVTQNELAELLGIDRASLVRAATHLRQAGAVETGRGVIRLLSLERLRKIALEAQ